jgi:hypothetical protein
MAEAARDAALLMLKQVPGKQRVTAGADCRLIRS